MALTTIQKYLLSAFIIAGLSTGTFVFYKVEQNYGMDFKVAKNSYILLGVEINNDTEAPYMQDFYLRLNGSIKLDKQMKAYLNTTSTSVSSITIPYSTAKSMIKIEFFDQNGKPIDLPHRIEYLSGTSWKVWPPKSGDLTISTTNKRFRVVANSIPNDTAVSLFVGMKFTLFGQPVEIGEDPLVWFNGDPLQYDSLENCKLMISKNPIYASVPIEKPVFGNCMEYTGYYFFNNATQKTSWVNTSASYKCQIGSNITGYAQVFEKYEQYYDCQNLGIVYDGNVLLCPEGRRCGVDNGKYCILNCNDGGKCKDPPRKSQKAYGWDVVCKPIDDILKGSEFRVSTFKDEKVKVQ
jgi:hypothetical protein